MKNKIRKLGLAGILSIGMICSITSCNKENAKDYYKEGITYIESEEYEKAGQSLKKAIELKSDKAEYYIAYGMSLVKLEEYKKAKTQFQKAILKKDNQIVRENNKTAYRGLGICYFEQGKYSAAIKQFNKALEIEEIEEMNFDLLSYKATAEKLSGKTEEAIKTCTQAIKKEKSNAYLYGLRAELYQQLEKYKEALTDYDKAISLEKDNISYYFGKYDIYKLQEDTESANKVLEEAAAIKTDSKEAAFYTARIHFLQEDYNLAATEFENTASSGYIESYYYLGQIELLKGNYEAAIAQFKDYLNQDGEESAVVYNQLAVCYLKMKEYEDAFSAIQKGLKLNNSTISKELLYNKVIALEHLGRFEKAKETAEQFLVLYPESQEMLKEYSFIKTRIREEIPTQSDEDTQLDNDSQDEEDNQSGEEDNQSDEEDNQSDETEPQKENSSSQDEEETDDFQGEVRTGIGATDVVE